MSCLESKSPFSHVILVTRPSKGWEPPFLPLLWEGCLSMTQKKTSIFFGQTLTDSGQNSNEEVVQCFNLPLCLKNAQLKWGICLIHMNHLTKGSSEVLIGQWSSWLKFGIVPNRETLNDAQSSKCLRCAFFGHDDSNTNFAPWIHLLSNGSSKSCFWIIQIFSWGLDLENEWI